MPRTLTATQKEQYALVKQHMREWAKKISKHEKVNKRVTFRLHKAHHDQGMYVYVEVEDGRDMGRVTMRVNGSGPYLESSFMYQRRVNRALQALKLLERLKTTKSENRWKGARS